MPRDGLLYPPASVEDIPFVTRPRSEGGVLERKGMVEVISSLEADGREIPYDIRMGVWVTVEAETEYIKNCFEEYNAHTDPSGRYFTLYKRWHLIGLEVGMSVASVALRGEPTGVATCWNADVVATAKRDLAPGEMLDGEGGYTVWGKLLPAERSMQMGGLPLGLAHDVKVVRPVKKGQSLSWADVAMDTVDATPTSCAPRWRRCSRRRRRKRPELGADPLGVASRAAGAPAARRSPALYSAPGAVNNGKRSESTSMSAPNHLTDPAAVRDPMPQPPPPLDPDACCGQGCDPCVLELQAEALDRYRAELARWRARQDTSVELRPASS